MIKKSVLHIFILIVLLYNRIYAQELLRFKYNKNDNYRFLSTVTEDVLVNGITNNRSQIVNRITINITDVDENDRGLHDANYMTTEVASISEDRQKVSWGQEYHSSYYKDKLGIYEIDSKYYMPVVRNLPVFPDYPVKEGDTWTASGYETEDMRKNFDIKEPVIIPFTANYKYEKNEDGYTSDASHTKKTFQVITASYTLYHELPEYTGNYEDYPVHVMGYSNQTIWWDNEKGHIDHTKENFRIIFETFYGNKIDFTGSSHVEVTEYKKTATDKDLSIVQNKIVDFGIENVTVKKSENGLTISIENIQFKPDSAILEDSEKNKLDKIAQILKEYPDNDLLIGGHTTNGGTEQGRIKLSEQRAQAVSDYLILQGVRDTYHIFSRGYAGRNPIAPNDTEQNKAKNRRVEITILDK